LLWRLVNAIDSTKEILNDLRVFSKEEWVIRYPPHREQQLSGSTKETADDNEHVVHDADFQILRLDLKVGPHGSSNSPAALVSQLEKSSIANLLDERMGASISHIEKLRARVEDTSSKVLVTGDLNSGKSTFVNALLRREVMPVDQQPCTTAFCEVHDAAENDGKEEVHVLKEGVVYDKNDDTTFEKGKIEHLSEIVGDNETVQKMIKVYLADSRAPSESLLNNGVVDISLIDAPGLNRDSLKTTALFARQEEIDVVVFVVSAENHFTLSSKEFLWNASNEKAYIFIIVNKYEQIKDKAKCRRLVLEQIKQLSPRTYDDANDLVHFVDSAAALQPFTANPAFDDLESALRSFVLVKRSKSKLHPVSTYLANLLADIEFLSSANAIVAKGELERAKDDLERVRPVLEKMRSGREGLEDGLEAVEEEGAGTARSRTKTSLEEALERVAQGKLGIDKSILQMPSYPGLLGIWNYAQEVRKVLLTSLDLAVKAAEDEARVTTTLGVKKIGELAEGHLPEGVERSKRVFMPEAMFTVRNGRRTKSGKGGAIVAGGLSGLGIGLAQRQDLTETTFFDIFDVHHQFWVHFGDEKSASTDDEDSTMSALSIVSVGIGALTMVGGQAIGARTLIEGFIRVSEALSNESSRRWMAPVIGAGVIGLTAYLVLELPSSIPKTVGRRVKHSVIRNSRNGQDDWAEENSVRISRETRKVLRLASWDLRERFRAAMEERGKEVGRSEEMERKAGNAKAWFEGVIARTGVVREYAVLNA
jgi:mitofusin